MYDNSANDSKKYHAKVTTNNSDDESIVNSDTGSNDNDLDYDPTTNYHSNKEDDGYGGSINAKEPSKKITLESYPSSEDE